MVFLRLFLVIVLGSTVTLHVGQLAAEENVWNGACQNGGCGQVACPSCCCNANCCPKPGLLGGLIQPSDTAFDDFISPTTNFVFFEDPRTVTELRPIFVNHWVPNAIGNGIPAGGTIQLYALQFRAALSERLSLIAVKDGFIVDDTGGTLDGLLDDGWAAVSAGLKYNLIRDTSNGRLLSAGFTYELPIGSGRALQAIGDGEFHLFATAGQRLLGGDAHVLSSFGYRLPVDDNLQTTAVHWSNHFDVRLTEQTYLFTELVWWNWTDSAAAGALLGVAGQDLFNLPAADVTGNNLVTQAVGAKLKPSRSTEIGVAYEYPISGFKDVLEGRVTADLILRY